MKYFIFVFLFLGSLKGGFGQGNTLTCSGITFFGTIVCGGEEVSILPNCCAIPDPNWSGISGIVQNSPLCSPCCGGIIIKTGYGGGCPYGLINPQIYRATGSKIIEDYHSVEQIVTINLSLLDSLDFDLYVKSFNGSAKKLTIKKHRQVDADFVEYKLSYSLEPKSYIILVTKDKTKIESLEVLAK